MEKDNSVKQCYKCQNFGHIAADCPFGLKKQLKDRLGKSYELLLDRAFRIHFIPESIIELIGDIGILKRLLRLNNYGGFIYNYKLPQLINNRIYKLAINKMSYIDELASQTVQLEDDKKKAISNAEKLNEEKQKKADENFEFNLQLSAQIQKFNKEISALKKQKTDVNSKSIRNQIKAAKLVVTALKAEYKPEYFTYEEVPELIDQPIFDSYINLAAQAIIEDRPEAIEMSMVIKNEIKKEKQDEYNKRQEAKRKEKLTKNREYFEMKRRYLEKDLEMKEKFLLEKKEMISETKRIEALLAYFRIPRCPRCKAPGKARDCTCKLHTSTQDMEEYNKNLRVLKQLCKGRRLKPVAVPQMDPHSTPSVEIQKVVLLPKPIAQDIEKQLYDLNKHLDEFGDESQQQACKDLIEQNKTLRTFETPISQESLGVFEDIIRENEWKPRKGRKKPSKFHLNHKKPRDGLNKGTYPQSKVLNHQ